MTEHLPVPPNESTYQTLVRAQRMLSHALGHASGGDAIDRMITIHGLDNTVEFLLRIICDHLELESKTGKSLDYIDLSSLLGATSKALFDLYNYRLPYMAEIKVLRQMRNLVQHGAIDPQGDVGRFTIIVERFFCRVIEDVFGFEDGHMVTSKLIDNDEVKAHLQRAEKLFEERKFLDAVIASRDAFENAYYHRARNSDITLSILPAIVEAKGGEGSNPWSLVTIKKELELTRLGINSEETHRFLDYIDYIPYEYQAKGHARVLQREWTKEDAQFCYQYAANTALHWQSQDKPPIDSPSFDLGKYRHEEKFAFINLSEKFEGGCAYFYSENSQMNFWYVKRPIRDQFEKLKIGEKYTSETELFIDGTSDGIRVSHIKLLGVYSELSTCNPERWKVIVWYAPAK